MSAQEEKWSATNEVVSERPKIDEVSGTPLGGERIDEPVDLDAEREKRAAAKEAETEIAAKTAADMQKIRSEIKQNIPDTEPITHRRQWLEGEHPTRPVPEEPENSNLLTRNQLRSRKNNLSAWDKVRSFFGVNLEK